MAAEGIYNFFYEERG